MELQTALLFIIAGMVIVLAFIGALVWAKLAEIADAIRSDQRREPMRLNPHERPGRPERPGTP